ncbi:protein of unknown function [Burkholderia multivorans]
MSIINKFFNRCDAEYEAARREVIEQHKARRIDKEQSFKGELDLLSESLTTARQVEKECCGDYWPLRIKSLERQIKEVQAKRSTALSGLRNAEQSELAWLEVKFGKVVQTEPEKPWEPIRII